PSCARGHSALSRASCRHVARRSPVVLKKLSGVSKRPMILSMPTTARSQRRYDHRLRDLVQRTGDVTIATDLGVPRSTARGWLGVAPTAVICLDDVDLNQPRRQGRDVMMTDFDSLPMPLQRAIATRDAAVKPFMATIESLDVSWTIVRGNLGDLLGTIDVF